MQPKEDGFGETGRKHLCQSGKMQPEEESLGEPEGNIYAGVRSDDRTPGETEFEHIIKLVAIKTPDKKCEENLPVRENLSYQFTNRQTCTLASIK